MAGRDGVDTGIVTDESGVGLEFAGLWEEAAVCGLRQGVMLALAAIPGVAEVFRFFPGGGDCRISGVALEGGTGFRAALPAPRRTGKRKTGQWLRKSRLKHCSSWTSWRSKMGYALVTAGRCPTRGRPVARPHSGSAQESGFAAGIPGASGAHHRQTLRLKPREYVISLRGVEVARWEMREGQALAISSEASAATVGWHSNPGTGVWRLSFVD